MISVKITEVDKNGKPFPGSWYFGGICGDGVVNYYDFDPVKLPDLINEYSKKEMYIGDPFILDGEMYRVYYKFEITNMY